MILYLRTSNCEKSEKIKALMTDELWPLVQVKYTKSTQPFLQLEDRRIYDPEEIANHLIEEANLSPSTIEQLRNAQEAASRALGHALQGGEVKAPKDLRDHRRSICETCPFNQKKFFVRRCSKCGCSIKAKTAVITEACPIGKW